MENFNINFGKFFLFSFLILSSCSSYNKHIVNNEKNNLIILDYWKTKKSYIKKYSLFNIEKRKTKYQNIEAFTVLPIIDDIPFKLYLEEADNAYLPNKYIEYEGKVFFWKDESAKRDENFINYINKKQLLDSTYLKFQMGLINEEEIKDIVSNIDESIEGVSYLFCKQSNTKINKKIISNKYFDPSDKRLKLDCN